VRHDLRAPQELAGCVDALLTAIDAHFRGDGTADPVAILQALPSDTFQRLRDLTAADPALHDALAALGAGIALDDADLVWARVWRRCSGASPG
jgi:hypothetical protein